MKKIIALLLSVAVVLSISSVSFAEEDGDENVVDLYDSGITDSLLAEMVANGKIPKNTVYIDLSYNQISDLSPLAELTELMSVDLSYNRIEDISPLGGLKKLEGLILWGNFVSDISPLSELTELYALVLDENYIIDISALKGLTEMQYLGLSYNLISDISPLASLKDLYLLLLDFNEVSDLTPLHGLSNLGYVSLEFNPLKFREVSELIRAVPSDCEVTHDTVSPAVGQILGDKVGINDALEILRYLAKLDSAIEVGNDAWYESLITGGSKPSINDALEILKYLAKLPGLISERLEEQ
ncbi:MAG: leucine-rich repeat domain-containing protein [Oscillospiraceae bacterium]|nr:leucine-rich repeat domain-containing protein [Oscillospiraceae bacterium]